MTGHLDFTRVGAAALANAESICRRVLPGGKVQGHEYVALNPLRADSRAGSLKVNLRTGRWADFATGDRGGDLTALVASLFDLPQPEAARRLASLLPISSEAAR